MKLNPKQKKIAMALGGGAVLALIVLLSRRGAPSDAEQQAAAAAAYPGDPGPSSFADNGAASAEMSSTIAEGLGRVSTSLDDVVGGFNAQTDAINALANRPPPDYNGRFDELGSAIATLAADPPAPQTAPSHVANAGRPAARPRPSAQVNSHGQKFKVYKAPRGTGYVHVYQSGKQVPVQTVKPGQKVSPGKPPPPHKPPHKKKKR